MNKQRNVDELCVSPDMPLGEIIVAMERGAQGIVMVVDQARRLLGTVSDGDIRRAVLDRTPLNVTAKSLLEAKAGTPYGTPISVSKDTQVDEIRALMKKEVVRQIPLLDSKGRVADLITWEDVLPNSAPVVQAVVMAGGEGLRLRPLTDAVPKPMLHVGDQPILGLLLDRLKGAGIHEIHITTRYRGEQIQEHFGDGSDLGLKLSYVPEDEPMGTAGSLRAIESNEPLLVVNGDVVTDLDFDALMRFHTEHNAMLTVAVRKYEVSVPFGVVEAEGAAVISFGEKPTLELLINAGIYLIEPEALSKIPAGRRSDMTDLIEKLIEDGEAVMCFPVLEYWLDIGQHSDYRQAQEDAEKGRFKT